MLHFPELGVGLCLRKGSELYKRMIAARKAAECIRDWHLDRPGDDGSSSHMEQYGYTAEHLAGVFAAYPALQL